MQSITENLAEIYQSYQYANFPKDIKHLAKLVIIDNLGCLFKGIDEPIANILSEDFFGRPLNITEILTAGTGDLYHQARLYSVTAHAIDYDDTFVPALAAHAGSAVLGAAWAQALQQDASGEDLLEAVVVGYEIAARVGSLLQTDHYAKGFHSTSTIGVFGACAASARLLGLDAKQFSRAVGIAATQAAGLKCTFGTMTKPFNAGQATVSGLMAARLAKREFSAPMDALEADKGYLQLFFGKPESERELVDSTHYFIRENAFKFHAACHATHPVIEAINAMSLESPIEPENIQQVAVTVSPISKNTASIETPKSGLECKFSIPQVTAFALAGMDTAADDTYCDEVLGNEGLNGLRERISLKLDEEIHPFTTEVVIEYIDGIRRKKMLDLLSLSRDIDYISEALRNKFYANTAHKLGRNGSENLLEKLSIIEHFASVSAITDLLKEKS